MFQGAKPKNPRHPGVKKGSKEKGRKTRGRTGGGAAYLPLNFFKIENPRGGGGGESELEERKGTFYAVYSPAGGGHEITMHEDMAVWRDKSIQPQKTRSPDTLKKKKDSTAGENGSAGAEPRGLERPKDD